MQTKVIAGIVALIIVIIGGYFLYTATMQSSENAPDTTTNATSTPPTEQVQAQEVKLGTGAEAVPGSTVSVLYVGQLQDGTVFDSSEAHKDPQTGKVEPLTFVLGAPGLIPGFQVGVNGMKVGGERLISIPPSLGYGSEELKDPSGKVVIPANSTIVFRLQLIKVAPAATSTPQQ